MAPNGKLQVSLEGPLFTRDVHRTIRENIQQMMEGFAEEGERLAVEDARSRRSAKAPHFDEWIRGRAESMRGRPWAVTAVISSQFHFNNINARGQHYGYGQKLEARYHTFRRVANALRNSRTIARANLTAGLE